MTIRAVIFDLGGVIVRTEDGAPRVELARRLGLSRSELEKEVFDCEVSQRAQLGQVPAEEFWETICAGLRYPKQDWAEFERVFWSGDRLDIGLMDYVRSLRPRFKTGLLSNAYTSLRHYLANYYRILDAFDVVVISAEVGVMKPDPRIFQRMVNGLAVRPDEAVFIDDFVQNVEGARAVGLHAVQFTGRAKTVAAIDDLLAKNV